MLYGDMILLFTSISKWILISVTVLSSGTLVWKILSRKSLHTLFNLGMCFYFFFTSSIFSFEINEYANIFEDRINEPEALSPESCHMLHLYRVVAMQGLKVFFLNVLFR